MRIEVLFQEPYNTFIQRLKDETLVHGEYVFPIWKFIITKVMTY